MKKLQRMPIQTPDEKRTRIQRHSLEVQMVCRQLAADAAKLAGQPYLPSAS